MRKHLLGLLLTLGASYGYGTSIYQFEKDLPSNIKVNQTSDISISTKKYKDGKKSLEWLFKPNDKLSILGDVNYTIFKKGEPEKARASYAMWIYNEKPIDDIMKVEFKKNGKTCSWFPINMNFTGWRTMWVQYDRDMQGAPEENMDEIVLTAPNAAGKIYIDQIIPSVLIDPRHNARDEQVDFINIEADTAVNAHWMALYKNYKQIEKLDSTENISIIQMEGIKSVEEKLFKQLFKAQEVNLEHVEKVKNDFEQIQKKSLEFIQRLVIYKDISEEEKKNLDYILTKDFGIYLRNIAYMYNSTNDKKLKEELSNIFINSLDYMYEQGWTKGSSQGTIHHLGYQMREIYEAIFLMKYPLKEKNKLKDAQEMVAWYSGMGMIYTSKNELRGINIDILNTMLPGMLISILLNNDENKESQQLIQLNKYLTHSILYSPGLLGGFKDDGSVFHHMQNYPAYAKGAFEGLTPIVYFLSNTPFSIEGEAYNKIKTALLMSRIYSNKYNYLLSLTGRHPNGKFKIDSEGFKYIALSGKGAIDKELAQAYLRLNPKGDYSEEFKKLGFKAESAPTGSWTMNMGSLQLQRRDNWLAGVKGFSRYLVGNETYIKNNLYGRYMSYGSFQILQDSLEKSGYVQEGWDWAHYPGTTAIALPIDKLKSSISQVDTASGVEEMLFSDETYSGGNSLNNDGMFAMKLHEHPKYDGSHRARKSVFFFGNRAILLGSNIENLDKVNETHTTIFQNYLGKNNIPKTLEKFNGNTILEDSQNNLYKIENNEVILRKGLQESRDQNTGEKTKNNYELAYINHKTAPKNESYHYSVLIKGSEKEKNEFKNDSGYKVLKQNKNAHIVQDKKSSLRGYAFFEPQSLKKDTFILKIDTPSLILLKPEKNLLEMSFVDPDLRLYEGIDQSQYDKNGNRKEVSIYSRDWKKNDGVSHTSKITLKGKWRVIDENKKIKSSVEKDNTTLEITTKYGIPARFKLEKI